MTLYCTLHLELLIGMARCNIPDDHNSSLTKSWNIFPFHILSILYHINIWSYNAPVWIYFYMLNNIDSFIKINQINKFLCPKSVNHQDPGQRFSTNDMSISSGTWGGVCWYLQVPLSSGTETRNMTQYTAIGGLALYANLYRMLFSTQNILLSTLVLCDINPPKPKGHHQLHLVVLWIGGTCKVVWQGANLEKHWSRTLCMDVHETSSNHQHWDSTFRSETQSQPQHLHLLSLERAHPLHPRSWFLGRTVIRRCFWCMCSHSIPNSGQKCWW